MAAACSRESTHRWLVFFYDGVPPLDTAMAHVEFDGPQVLENTAEGAAPRRVKAGKKYSYLPPYRENRCLDCHDVRGGRLLETVRKGLCRSCHCFDKFLEKKFVHGPVAVNACLACHHQHKSLHPKVLIADPQTVCFNCHEMGELTTDKHHATIDEELCIDCHDAHGGDDRFYLLPGVAAAGSP